MRHETKMYEPKRLQVIWILPMADSTEWGFNSLTLMSFFFTISVYVISHQVDSGLEIIFPHYLFWRFNLIGHTVIGRKLIQSVL